MISRNVFLALFTGLFLLTLSGCQPTSASVNVDLPESAPLDIQTRLRPPEKQPDATASPLPPQVIDHSPAAGEEAAPDSAVEVLFDQPMDRTSVETAFQMMGPGGQPVAGTFSWPDPARLRFQPAAPLVRGSTYQVRISEKAASQKGVALSSALEFRIHTITPLQVSQVFPVDGASQVEISTAITVTFNRPVVALGIAEEQTGLVQPINISPEARGAGEWVSTSVYVFQPDKALKTNTTYMVKINAGLLEATGNPGAALPEDFEWQFTTLPGTVLGLEIDGNGVEPANPYMVENTSLQPKIVLTFGQAMDAALTSKSLTVSAENGEKAPLRSAWSQGNSQVTLTPTRLLAMSSAYTLVLSEQAADAEGSPLGRAYQWTFRTIGKPGVRMTIPTDGQTRADPQFEIDFNSPMDLKSVTERVIFQPPLKDKNSFWYNDEEYKIFFYGLEPSTQYTVTLQAGMRDRYGNAINTPGTVSFTTAPIYPGVELFFPYDALYRAGRPQEFSIRYVNIRSLELKLYRLTTSAYIKEHEQFTPLERYAPNENDLVWQYTETSSAAVDERVMKKISMTGKDGKPLPAGVYFLGLNSPSIEHKGRFISGRYIVIASANLTFKFSMNDALLWVTDFETGKPIADVPLKIYDKFTNKLAEGSTDADGLLKVELPASAEEYASLYAASDGSNIFVFASSGWGSGVSASDFGIWEQYYSPLNNARAYVYSDRPLYRPGQPVYFKGIVRVDDDLDYSIPDQAEVEVTIRSFDEKEIYREKLPLSSFGSFNGQLKLDQEAALGGYNLAVRLPGKEDITGSLTFTVAEYRKPEFQVEITPEVTDILGGRQFKATVAASYYSGGGVSGAEVSWQLRTSPFYFKPPDKYSSYSFSDDERDSGPIYLRRPEEVSQVLAEGKGVTGEDGKLTISMTADISKANASQNLTVDVTVTDFSGFSVSGQANVAAHQSEVYAGIRSKQYIGRSGQEQAFQLVALNWDGQPAAGQRVRVDIVERQWQSVQEQDALGNLSWKTSVKDVPVTTFSSVTLDENGEGEVSFTPEKGGVYRARVTALDRYGNPSRAAAYIWVAGDQFIPWRQTNDRSFQLVVDRDSYAPGDTAEILIASPFQGQNYALVTVERGRIRSQEVLRLDSNSTLYRLPVKADMAPVVYVSVLIVKGVDETNPRPNFKIGMAKINVSTEQQALNVAVSPDKQNAGPGEQVSYTVTTTTTDGKPVEAEVSLGLSDLATLALLPPNSEPILDYFYAPRALSVHTAVALSLNMEDYNAQLEAAAPEGRGGGSGGGKGEGTIGVPEIRQDFPDTAFWKADVLTGEDGKAEVAVRLPDSLTTWRMDARAVTEDTRVGQATQDLISSRPLLVRPQTPRFFVAGDQVTLGTAVHNNTGEDLTVDVQLEATGVELEDEPAQRVEIKDGAKAYITWQASVPLDSQRVDLVFRAKGGSFTDASRPTLGTLDNNGIPVYRYEAPETVATAGQLESSGVRTEVIRLPREYTVTQGNLKVKIEPSLAAGMSAGLTYLEHYPYECTEQTVSRFLPNVLSTQAMKAAGLSDAKLEAGLKTQVNTALQKLYNQQNSDGGWGWWAGSKSSETTSAYVVLGLVEAKNAGYTVDSSVLDRSIEYLRQRVSQLFKDKAAFANGGRNRQALLLFVLARTGYPDVSYTVQLADAWQQLDLYARGFLAQTLALIDPNDPRLDTLRSDLVNQAIISATGAHWEEKTVDYWNWSTNTRTTAIVLDTLIRIDPKNTLNPGAVRWLMANRKNGHWSSTQETAWTLMTLTDWMAKSGELKADYTFTATLNGKPILEGSAGPDDLTQVRSVTASVQDLLQDAANALVFSRTGDPGNLYYTADLNVSLPVGRVKALDQGLIISRSYTSLEDSKTPVTQARQGDLLKVRLTVVAPNDLHYLLIEDPLPAGLEAVDTSLKTSPQGEAPEGYDWKRVSDEGWGWWYFSHVELRDEKLVLSTDYLPAGTYVYTYLARASTPGTFQVIPPTGQEFYFPEVYGRGEGSVFVVK